MAQRISRGWGRTKPPPGTGIDWGHPLGRGLIGAWPLNERGGSKVIDCARGSVGSYASGISWKPGPSGLYPSSDGSVGPKADLNGTINRLAIPQAAGTLSMWWCPLENPATNSVYLCMIRDNSGSNYWGCMTYSGDQKLYGGWYSVATEGRATAFLSNTPIAQGRWSHIVLSWVSGTGSNLYVDGNLVASIGNTPTWDTSSSIAYLGYLHVSFDYSSMAADNIRIYNRSLSQSEIRRLYSDPWAGYYCPRRKIISPGGGGGGGGVRKLLGWAADGRPEELSDVEAAAYLVSLGH